jgi:hypothetical protein
MKQQKHTTHRRMKMATRIDTEDFVNTYGECPKGNGDWSFNLGRNGAWTEVSYSGDYSDAKRFAVKEAKSLGCSMIVLNA